MKMAAAAVREAKKLLDALDAVEREIQHLGVASQDEKVFEFGANDDDPGVETVRLAAGIIRDTLLHMKRLISDRLTAMGVDPWA